jgi:KDO2-lipid IV(A) lauroyltransferase
MKDTLRKMLADKKDNRLTFNAFLSDQSTIWEETQYWTEFLNQLTPVHLGAEKIAMKTGHPVVFYHIRKVKRGYYDVDIIPLVEDVSKMKENEITEQHVRLLESIIRETPHQWLWTHRRWKLTSKKLSEMEEAG